VQPALPLIVREWLPEHIGLGTAVTTNGYLIGSTMATGLSLPLIMPLVSHSWRIDLGLWAIPVLIAAILNMLIAPVPRAPQRNVPGARKWMPDWKSPLVWLLGLTLGTNTAVFFGVNAFLPEHLQAIGRSDLISTSLVWVNGSQVIASFMLLVMAESLQRRAWSYLVFGPIAILAVLGIMFGHGYWIVVSAALVGFGCAITFVVTLALPPVVSPAGEIHRVAAGMFTIAYTLGILLPVVCGAMWDLTGISAMAFVPFIFGLAALTIFGVLLMRFPVVKD
jgi:CP family cyanate transporter-like MFS transporter